MSHEQLKILVEISHSSLQICSEKAVFFVVFVEENPRNTRKTTHIYKVFLWNCFSFSLAFLEKLLMKILALGQQILTMKKKLHGLIYKKFYNLKFGRKILGFKTKIFKLYRVWRLTAK